MEKLNHYGLLGVFTILSGLLQILGWVITAFFNGQLESSGYLFGSILDLFGTVFFIFTVAAIFWLHASSEGWLNKASFILGIIGTSFLSANKFIWAFVLPYLHQKAPKLTETDPGFPLSFGMYLSFALFGIGVILLAILIIKAKKLPILVAIGFILGPIADYLPTGIPVGELIFALAVVYLGIKLSKQRQIGVNR